MLKSAGDAIPVEEIQRLIDQRVVEGRSLDYKQTVKTNDNDARELLEDLVSFANAEGGWILIGLKEAKAGNQNLDYPAESCDHGLLFVEFRKRVESMASDNIWPRLPQISLTETLLPNGHSIIGIFIAPSTIGPHVVERQGRISCCRRNNQGKQRLDAGELRDAILNSESVEQRFEEFVADRWPGNDKAPMPWIRNVPALVITVAPRVAFEQRIEVPMKELKRLEYTLLHANELNNSFLPTVDGVVSMAASRPESGYALMLRRGIFEIGDTWPFSREGHRYGLYIAPRVLLQSIERSLVFSQKAFAELNLEGPCLCSGQITGLASHGLFINHDVRRVEDLDDVYFPTLPLEDGDDDDQIQSIANVWMERLFNAFQLWEFDRTRFTQRIEL